MPEWFPSLVKKLWNEGEDVTKQVAYGERQIVKRGTLEGGRHLSYPMHTPFMNLGLSLLDKVGVEVASISDSTGRLSDL